MLKNETKNQVFFLLFFLKHFIILMLCLPACLLLTKRKCEVSRTFYSHTLFTIIIFNVCLKDVCFLLLLFLLLLYIFFHFKSTFFFSNMHTCNNVPSMSSTVLYKYPKTYAENVLFMYMVRFFSLEIYFCPCNMMG